MWGVLSKVPLVVLKHWCPKSVRDVGALRGFENLLKVRWVLGGPSRLIMWWGWLWYLRGAVSHCGRGLCWDVHSAAQSYVADQSFGRVRRVQPRLLWTQWWPNWPSWFPTRRHLWCCHHKFLRQRRLLLWPSNPIGTPWRSLIIQVYNYERGYHAHYDCCSQRPDTILEPAQVLPDPRFQYQHQWQLQWFRQFGLVVIMRLPDMLHR